MGQEPEQLKAEIAQTRDSLDQDLSLLAEKVSPAKIAERRVEATRGALTSVKERVMGSSQSAMGSAMGSAGSTAHDLGSSAHGLASSVGGAVGSAPSTAKDKAAGNPLAAGVIAFGAGWLLSSLMPASQAESQAAAKIKDAVAEPVKQQLTSAANEVREQLAPAAQEAAESLKGTATEAVGAVKEQAADAAGTVKEQAADSAATVKDQAQEAKGQVQDAAGSGSSAATTPTQAFDVEAARRLEDPLSDPLPRI